MHEISNPYPLIESEPGLGLAEYSKSTIGSGTISNLKTAFAGTL